MIGILAEQYGKDRTRCYDLGCSLGAGTATLREGLSDKDCSIVAVDLSKPMMDKCQANLAKMESSIPVDYVLDDIRNVGISNASIVVLNFTLQFIPIEERDELLKKIHHGLVEGGVLIVSEKIRFPDSQIQSLQSDLHLLFKKKNGYSDLEISQKRSSLEKVLLPETVDDHKARLSTVGFNNSETWFQCFNFVSLFAVK